MTQTLSEDDLYRASTQFRLWSFSPAGLATLRRKTHDLAVERARQSAGSISTGSNGLAPGNTSDYVTEDEELRLIRRYSSQILATSDHFKFPAQVKATAVQYLRRFYLSNSCLTYPPKDIYKTALFLACKTEATHMTLSEYARRIATDPDIILAPEYKVMQALRFTLDVRQPYRGLKGVLMEMENFADGRAEDMLALEGPPEGARTVWKVPASGVDAKQLMLRVEAAYSAARSVLDGPALLTDAYFLYTPSQILLAALYIADPPLTDMYLTTKLPLASSVRPRILATIHACAELLASFSDKDIISKEERTELEKRLERCRDVSTKDLVKAHMAAKRGSDSDEEEKKRKRKAARERSIKEGEDLFGPSLNGKG